MKWLLDVLLISHLKSKEINHLMFFREELFYNIQKGVLRIPASLSEDAKNLIVSLLNRNPSRRLGAGPEGADEIKRHPFFKDLDW